MRHKTGKELTITRMIGLNVQARLTGCVMARSEGGVGCPSLRTPLPGKANENLRSRTVQNPHQLAISHREARITTKSIPARRLSQPSLSIGKPRCSEKGRGLGLRRSSACFTLELGLVINGCHR